MSVLLHEASAVRAGALTPPRLRVRDRRHSASVRVARRYPATPARAFEAWLDPRIAREWLFATAGRPMVCAEIDPHVGGSFRLVEQRHGGCIEHCGTYATIAFVHRLEFTLTSIDLQHAVTRVSVDIATTGRGCEVVVIHDHVPSGSARRVQARWTGILYGLGATLAAHDH